MSRSYAPSEDGYSRYSASSPMSYADDDAPNDPSLRPMRLKVLYTCDDKSNCMAKWYQIVHVRTAFLDERTEVGVVELKTCIKAIVTCSPELVAKLGQDYTVYAYDYSEYETPLVGQGMLSWVLASSSPTPSAPAEQSSTMVTGRVTKNVKALFSRDSITETLEVKLRLVPVPTILQSEYIESMKKYRDISQVMPEDFDSRGWTDFLNANPQVLSMIGSGRNESPQNRNNVSNNIGIEQVQRLMQRTNSFNQRPQGLVDRRDSFAGSVASHHSSRVGSPTPSTQTRLQEPFVDQPGRPDSRASNQSFRRGAMNEGLEDAGFASNDERQDDGPARKRARTTQVRRPKKGDAFGGQVDSLRVVASGAASVRVLQPTAMRPGPVTATSLEDPPRAPTPTAQRTLAPRRAPLQPRRSGLGQVMSSFQSSDQTSMFHDSRLGESSITSPEAQSAVMSSPGEDPGSSPPVPPSRGVSAAPSSPQLPRLPPPHEDSGFMSGAMDEDYIYNTHPKPTVENGQQAFIAALPTSEASKPPAKGKKAAAKRPRADSTNAQLTAEEKAAEVSRRNARRAIGWRRIQSWTEGQDSDTTTPTEMPPPEYPKPPQAENSRAKSKQAYDRDHQNKLIQGRLNSAIEAGEMPPYCENCGDINTPTWRKAWTRIYSGAPDNVTLSKEPGGVVAVQIVEQDPEGNITLFKIIKKSLLEHDQDFSQMLLCNPCGLWLVNRKQMRPPEKWAGAKQKKEPRSGSGRSRQRTTGRGRSATAAPSEATEPPSEMSLPPFEQRIDPRLSNSHNVLPPSDVPEQDEEAELPTLPDEPVRPASKGSLKARSDGNAPPHAIAALQRAIQSSPGHTRGSKHSPIEVDKLTPNRTRRALFPSPKSAGPLGVSSGNRQRHSLQNSPDAPKQHSMLKPQVAVGNSEQENAGPTPMETQARPATPSPDDETDYLHDLFNDPKAPVTPSRSNNFTLPIPQSPSNTFKTPTKPTPQKHGFDAEDLFSSATKKFLHPPRTPSRTPGRKTQETPAAETPFTRHLNQLLSEPVEGFAGMNTSPSALFADFGVLNDFAMSTDLPMPSSPPIGAGVTKTPVAEDWSEFGFNSSPFKGSPSKSGNARGAADENTMNEQGPPAS